MLMTHIKANHIIDTYNQYEQPIEHLFKAIYILQAVDELQVDTQRLVQKLHTRFKRIPEEKGKRHYSRITYHSNGLCEWQENQIILPGWQSTYIPEEPEKVDPEEEMEQRIKKLQKEKKRAERVHTYSPHTGLRTNYPLWHAQLCEYLGKRYKPNKNHDLTKIMKQRALYDQLAEDEREVINKDYQIFTHMRHSCHGILNMLARHMLTQEQYYLRDNEQLNLTFTFLYPDELKALYKITEEAYLEYDRQKDTYYGNSFTSVLRDHMMNHFIPSLNLKRKGRVLMDFRPMSLEKTTIVKQNMIDVLIDFSQQVTDETHINILKTYDLYIDPDQEIDTTLTPDLIL